MSKKSELENQANAIIPQNLKDNETINKMMELYLSNLSNQQEFNKTPTDLLSTSYLIDKKSKATPQMVEKFNDVKTELFKIHLNEIYKIFESVEDSGDIWNRYREIYEALEAPTDDLTIDFNLDDEVNQDYITSSTSYKTKKGTKAGFFFVNDIINKVNIDPLNADPFFTLEEGLDGDITVPYAYTVKASLYKEVFKETILPLTHPVGFDWYFLRLMYLSLIDYFGIIETVTLTDLSITCYKLGDAKPVKKTLLKANRDSRGNILSVESTADGYGDVKAFYESKDQENRDKLVVDFFSKEPYPVTNETQDGLRLVRDYDGHIVIYQKQDDLRHLSSTNVETIYHLEIEKAELLDDRQGELTSYYEVKDNILGNSGRVQSGRVINSVRFKEYSIFDLDEVKIRISFFGGTPLDSSGSFSEEDREWTVVTLKLTNKIISTEKKFFESVDFSRKDLVNNASDFNGRVQDDKGMTCKIQYELAYSYEITTSDDSKYVTDIRDKAKADFNLLVPEYNEAGLLVTYQDNEENTVEEYDYKHTSDNWARLDSNNGAIYIGEAPSTQDQIGEFVIAGDNPIHKMDMGINQSKGPDADLLSVMEGDKSNNNWTYDYKGDPVWIDLAGDAGNNPDVVRTEHYYAPTSYRDLAVLDLGSKTDSGQRIYDVTNTPEIYERDNKGNETYAAREDKTVDEWSLLTHDEIALDPIYARGEMIDADGITSRGFFNGYAIIGSDKLASNNEDINDFVVGGYRDIEQGISINPHEAIYLLKSDVDADPVNLQYMTYDYQTNDDEIREYDNVNNSGDIRDGLSTYKNNEDGKESFADEINTTDITYGPYTDHYHYSQTDWDIGDWEGHDLEIGDFPILGIPVPITETRHSYLEISMTRPDIYSYNTFSNAWDDINEGSYINDGEFIGGEFHTETVNAEIYQAVWNTNEWNSDNIDKFRLIFTYDDNVNRNGDTRTPSSVSTYKNTEDGKESFADETNTTDITYGPYTDSYNWTEHEWTIHQLDTIGSFPIFGTETIIEDTRTVDETINMNRHPSLDYVDGFDWMELFEINQSLDTFEAGDLIGSDLYIDGRITYDFGGIDGFADPVNINKNTKDPSIFNIKFWEGYGENHDERDDTVNLTFNVSTQEWEEYITKPDSSVKWSIDTDELLEAGKLWSITRDYWEIEQQDFVIGEDDIEYVGGLPKPILEPENTVITWNYTVAQEYTYPTYVNILDTEIGNSDFVGGEPTHDTLVDAEPFKAIWDENNYFYSDKIAPSIIDDIDYIANDKVQGLDHSTESNYILENFNIEESDVILDGAQAIGDGTYITGKLVEVSDEKNSILYINTDILATYEYNTFNNMLELSDGSGEFIGGELYSEDVLAEIYQAVYNTNEWNSDNIANITDSKGITDTVETTEEKSSKDTVSTNDEDYNLRNSGKTIGEILLIIGDELSFVGGEIVQIDDNLNEKIVYSKVMGNNTHTEYIVASPLTIDENNTILIGDTWIKADIVTYTDIDAESYMNVGDFDIFSDEDNWTFGVYKNDGSNNYILLDDNNIDAVA